MRHGKRCPLHRWPLAGLACGLVALLPLQGMAQERDASNNSIGLFGDETEVIIGLGVIATQRYQGARQFRVTPVPTLSVSRGIFFADTVHGIGAQYLAASGFYASVALGYDLGRTEKDSTFRPGSNRLRGMGRIKGATTANLLLAQELTPWLSINGEAELRVAGHQRGNRYRLGLETTVLGGVEGKLTVSANLHAADGRYNQTHFGVTEAQGRASRFARFDAHSGVHAYSLSADWQRDLGRHWMLSVGLNVMQFDGKARDSPLVERRTGVTGFAALHYVL